MGDTSLQGRCKAVQAEGGLSSCSSPKVYGVPPQPALGPRLQPVSLGPFDSQ